MDLWIHDGFLDSRWILGFTMNSWIHEECLDSRWVLKNIKKLCGVTLTFLSRWPRHGMDTLTRRILTRHDTEFIDTIDIDTPWHATFRTWHAQNSMTRQKYGTKFLKIFVTHVPTSWGHVKKSETKFLKIYFTHVPIAEDMSNIWDQIPENMLHPCTK